MNLVGSAVHGWKGIVGTYTRSIKTMLYTLASRIFTVATVADCTAKVPVDRVRRFVEEASAIRSTGDVGTFLARSTNISCPVVITGVERTVTSKYILCRALSLVSDSSECPCMEAGEELRGAGIPTWMVRYFGQMPALLVPLSL